MISDRELWACANLVLNHRGPDVDRFIDERLSALTAAEDEVGVKTWSAIADRVTQLRDLRGRVKTRQ